MPINAHPGFLKAEQEYLQAETTEQKIKCLKKMLAVSPKHKGAENLNKQLKRRLARLKYTKIKQSKSGKSTKVTIKKSDMQVAFIGFTNSGKSAIMNLLTKAHPKISDHEFTTKEPVVGMMDYQGVQIQLIDLPSIGSEEFDIGLANTADLVLITVTKIEEIKKIQKEIPKAKAKQLVIFNKSDLLNPTQKRKTAETLRSKKYNFVLTSWEGEGIEELREKIFEGFEICRIYLKEPGKEPTDKPMIIKPGSTVGDVAKKISRELFNTIKDIHIWGPSSKFANQRVGLNHKVKDKDIVEFKTK